MLWEEANAADVQRLRDEIDDEDTHQARREIAARELAEIMSDAPVSDEAVALCVQAWHELNTCRQIGMDVGPIPFTAMLQWCDDRSDELDRDAKRQLIAVVQGLDADRSRREASKRALGQNQR